jgi:hypothetical protein
LFSIFFFNSEKGWVLHYEGMMTFMEMLKNKAIVFKHKNLFERKIKKLIIWFNRDYLGCLFTTPFPTTIGNVEVNLIDRYLMIKEYGEHNEVTVKDLCEKIGMSFGVPKVLSGRIRGVYERHFSMLDGFYETVTMDMQEDGRILEDNGVSKGVKMVQLQPQRSLQLHMIPSLRTRLLIRRKP